MFFFPTGPPFSRSALTSPLVTDRVRSTTVRYCFHRCLSVHIPGGGRCTPRYIPPSQPGPDGGMGVPTPTVKVPTPPLCQVPTGGGGGGTPRYLPHWPGLNGGEGVPQGTYLPPPRYLPPPPLDSAADGVLDSLRSVCLLRSRRRTFLFSRCFFVLSFQKRLRVSRL